MERMRSMEALRYFDAHVHMSWYADPASAMTDAASLGLGGICCTVDAENLANCPAPDADGAWALAAGLHPWWADGADLEAAVAAAESSRFVGEIGLDLGKKHAQTAEAQTRAFTAMCEAAQPGAVLSIHSVGAGHKVLDILEATGASGRCSCVFHWFSGASDELSRAVRAGCWFSLGESSLATRRGREYARQIPAGRLLTETDLPKEPGTCVDAAAHLASVQRAVAGIAAARGADTEEVRALVLANSRELIC